MAEVVAVSSTNRSEKRIEEHEAIIHKLGHITNQLLVQVVVGEAHLLRLLLRSDQLRIVGIRGKLLLGTGQLDVVSVHINQTSLSLRQSFLSRKTNVRCTPRGTRRTGRISYRELGVLRHMVAERGQHLLAESFLNSDSGVVKTGSDALVDHAGLVEGTVAFVHLVDLLGEDIVGITEICRGKVGQSGEVQWN